MKQLINRFMVVLATTSLALFANDPLSAADQSFFIPDDQARTKLEPKLALWLMDTDTTDYIMTNRVKKSQDGIFDVWLLKDYSTPKALDGSATFKSIASLESFDCRNNRLGLAGLVFYSDNKGKGQVVKQVLDSPDHSQMLPVTPNTYGETKLLILCSRLDELAR